MKNYLKISRLDGLWSNAAGSTCEFPQDPAFLPLPSDPWSVARRSVNRKAAFPLSLGVPGSAILPKTIQVRANFD